MDQRDIEYTLAPNFRPIPGSELLISVRETADAYVARPVRVVPLAVPTTATERVLLVDKVTGLLPAAVLQEQYRLNRDGRSLTFDTPHQA